MDTQKLPTTPTHANGAPPSSPLPPGALPRADASTPAPAKAASATDPQRSKKIRLYALGALGLALLGLLGYYALAAGRESTDDAQVEADVVAVPSRTGGVVEKIYFVENQPVKAGQVLAELDSKPQAARLAQAEAQLASAQAAADAADATAEIVTASAKGNQSIAQASLKGSHVAMATTADQIAQAKASVAAAQARRDEAKLDYDRAQNLYAAKAIPKQRLDAAQTGLDAAEANLAATKAALASAQSSTAIAQSHVSEARARVDQSSTVEQQIAQARANAAVAHAHVETAKAARDLAQLDLDYTRIKAPRDGIASKKMIEEGQMVAPGQTVVQVVPTDAVWVVANFKETQLGDMRPGQPAEISVDAYPGLKLHGKVESLSGATGARFSLLPPENATGNFVKVVQRVPVRIQLDLTGTDRPVLRAGMSADVTVDVRH